MSREIEEIRAEAMPRDVQRDMPRNMREGYVEGYTEGYALEEKKEMANRLNDFGLPVEQIAPSVKCRCFHGAGMAC